jgi:hypothetical protein
MHFSKFWLSTEMTVLRIEDTSNNSIVCWIHIYLHLFRGNFVESYLHYWVKTSYSTFIIFPSFKLSFSDENLYSPFQNWLSIHNSISNIKIFFNQLISFSNLYWLSLNVIFTSFFTVEGPVFGYGRASFSNRLHALIDSVIDLRSMGLQINKFVTHLQCEIQILSI